MPRRLLLLASLCLVAAPAFACGDDDEVDFGAYYGGPGPAATIAGSTVTIDTSFLVDLEAHPDGAAYDRHRHELLYLLSIDDEAALRAGVRVLAQLVVHPTIEVECDAPHELYGKEELAFALSRNNDMNDALCTLPVADRKAVIALYAAHPVLWQNVDDPWRYFTCKPLPVTP
jgi:hypothetical protein